MKQFLLSFAFLFGFIGITTAQNNKIELETSNDTSTNIIKIDCCRTHSTQIAPLYLVDGVEVKEIEDINVSQIKKIKVLKDEKVIEKYGKKAEGGVILIKMKRRRKQD